MISVRPGLGVSEAADRAGALIAEQIRAMLEAAEARAGEIREMTEREANDLRDGAVADAVGLIEFLEALERQIDEIVRCIQLEVDHLHATLGKHSASTRLPPSPRPRSRPEPEQSAPEPEPVEPAVEEPVAVEEPAAVEQATAVHDAVTAEEPERNGDHAHEDSDTGGGVFQRLRRRKEGRPFIDLNGQCEVCRRGYRAGGEERLHESGWQVSGEKGVCPQCQKEGWALQEVPAEPEHA